LVGREERAVHFPPIGEQEARVQILEMLTSFFYGRWVVELDLDSCDTDLRQHLERVRERHGDPLLVELRKSEVEGADDFESERWQDPGAAFGRQANGGAVAAFEMYLLCKPLAEDRSQPLTDRPFVESGIGRRFGTGRVGSDGSSRSPVR
jgi:hypothetical protein